MGNAGTEHPESAGAASTDLWKFFEQRGAEQKESMFRLVTWIIGLAAVVLGFAIKEGFEKGLEKVAHARLLLIVSFVGLFVMVHAVFVICDHGRHINRTFARADAARDGQSAPLKIWEAGNKAEGGPLPPICRQLLFVVAGFALCFTILIIVGLGAWLATA
jgi:hypothetical protein